MELIQLRSFKAVAHCGSFSRAADFLGLSQPAVSRHLAELEEELGVRLFSRDRRQIEITQSGSTFLTRTEAILHSLEEARAEIASLDNGESGRVHVGFLPYTSGPFLFRLLEEFRREHPGIHVLLHDMSPLDIQKALVSGKLDVGLNREIPKRAQEPIDSTVLASDHLVAVLPRDHPLADRETINLWDLQQEDFVSCKREFATPLFDATIQACAEQGFAPRIVSEAVTPHGAVFAVAGGSVVGITFSAIRFFFSEGVVFIPFRQTTPRLNLTLETRRGAISPSTDIFCEFIRQRIKTVSDILEKVSPN